MESSALNEKGEPSVSPQLGIYKEKLQFIFEQNMVSPGGAWCTALNNSEQNIWRTAWAFDTLIDYLVIMNEEQPGYTPKSCSGGSFIDDAITNALNPKTGNWWDDFGWLGIASLRAAEQLTLTAAQKKDLVRRAVNSWCFMYGNGWKYGTKPTDPPSDFNVPFPDDNWDIVIKNHNNGNIGAPNAFAHTAYEQFQPKYSPGGIWNAELGSYDTPVQSDQYVTDKGDSPYLAPIQNTVTNGLYLVLSLRVYKALINPAYADYFAGSQIDNSVVLKAWQDQLTWFTNWFSLLGNTEQSSLLYSLKKDGSRLLVRERVSMFYNGKWDAYYWQDLAWMGDQGLLIGALREANNYLVANPSNDPMYKKWLGTASVFPDILRAVRTYAYSGDGLPPEWGEQLRPWVQIGDNVTFNAFPAGDDPDYQTGVGVFYRYLSQVNAALPDLVTPFRDRIFDTANRICAPGFPDPAPASGPECDGMVRQISGGSDTQPFNYFTPWVNRMALLCIAIQLAKQ